MISVCNKILCLQQTGMWVFFRTSGCFLSNSKQEVGYRCKTCHPSATSLNPYQGAPLRSERKEKTDAEHCTVTELCSENVGKDCAFCVQNKHGLYDRVVVRHWLICDGGTSRQVLFSCCDSQRDKDEGKTIRLTDILFSTQSLMSPTLAKSTILCVYAFCLPKG